MRVSREVMIKRTGRTAFYVILIIFTVVFVIPLFSTIFTSVRTTGDIMRKGFWSMPDTITLGNFSEAWIRGRLAHYTKVTILITAPAVAGALLVASLGAYALASLRFRGNSFTLLFIVSCMFIPIQVLLIPVYKLLGKLNFLNTYQGLILIHITMAVPFCTFVLRNFFATIPNELRDAARIDGCSEIGIYGRILMPLAKPALAVLAILWFTFIWNDLLWGLVLMTDKRPIMVGLISLQGEYRINWSVQCAAALMASIPTLIVFLCFQRYFIRGLTVGAVKG